MNLPHSLVGGRLIKRYKRFLADVELTNGTVVTAHCPNTGSMLGCDEPGSQVWMSRSDNPKRKYPFTWELVEVDKSVLVGINTTRSNVLVREAIENGTIAEVSGYDEIRSEVRFGREGSRADLVLRREGWPPCFVEVKNVTAAVSNGVALFPDAVTARGTKHLRELAGAVAHGGRAVLCFSVQRGDAREVRPADDIDPLYGQTLREALAAGVEAVAYRAEVSTSSLWLRERSPVVCP